MHLRRWLLAMTLLALSGAASADNPVHVSPFEGWRSLQTERFSIQYVPADRALAEKSLAIAEEALPQIERFLDWKVTTRIYINLVDRQDASNGWATALPYNHLTLYTTPPTGFGELNDYNRWMRLLLAHELTHIVHLDMGRNAPLFGRKVFGRFYLLFPNYFQPTLFTEGLATYVETDWDHGFGRGQSAYFNMMMRTEVDSRPLGFGEVQQSRSDWPLNTAYLYGIYFYQFLESTYGKDKIPEYVGEYSTNLIPFMLSTTSRRVTDRNIVALWADYLAWLEKRFRTDIDAIKAAGVTPATQLTTRGYATGRPVPFAADSFAFVDVGLETPSWIVARSADGSARRVARVRGDARLIGVVGDELYFLQDSPCGERKVFTDLYRVSLPAVPVVDALGFDRAERLTECQRYTHGSISPSGKSFAFVQSLTGRQALVLRPVAGGDATVIWRGSYDEQLASPTWLDENTLVISRKQPDEKWQLYRVDVRDGGWRHLDTGLPRGNLQTPFYSADTASLYFTADHTGVYEIYRADAGGQGALRVTRSLTGSVDPWVGYGKLYYSGYTPDGWNIFVTDARATAGSDAPAMAPGFDADAGMHLAWNSANDQRGESGPVVDKPYAGLPSALPRSWMFASYSAGDSNEIGVTVNGNDALYFHSYLAGVAYESGLGKTSGMLEYTASNHFTLGYKRSFSITGNGIDPVKSGFAVNQYTVDDDLTGTAFYTFPFGFSDLTTFAGLESNGEKSFDNTGLFQNALSDIKSETTGVGLIYSSSHTYPHGISESHGRRIKATVERDDFAWRIVPGSGPAIGNDFGGDVQTLDWREYIYLGKRQVLALRGFFGRGEAGTGPFELGDSFSMLNFSSPYVHERSIALRGYPRGIARLRDVNAELYSAEWRMPVVDINRGISGWPIGAHALDATIFYDAGRVWGTAPNPVNRSDAVRYDSVGAELSAAIDLGYSMFPLLARLGYAAALDDTVNGDTSEVYFSLGTTF